MPKATRQSVSFVLAIFCVVWLCQTAQGQNSEQGWRDTCTVRFVRNQSWLLHFEPHSSELTQRAETILDELVEQWVKDGGEMLGIRPYVDRAEIASMDQNLASKRGEAVKLHLIRKGLPTERIWLDLTESERTQLETASGIAEPQNRVVILYPFGLGYRHVQQQRQQCLSWFRQHCYPLENNDAVAMCDEALHFILPDDN